jgi:Mg2+-importing ATPase
MLPVQILLNNLLYDVSELPIPLDRVDDDYLSHPRHWDMNFIRNFMLIIGPVSSVFDFLTFYVMLAVFHAGEALFHTGWFIESMATQVLVIFIIRTRKNPFKSRPNPWLIACSLTVVAVAVLLPFTPAGAYLGFVAPPAFFFLILIAMLLAYLLAVEWMKQWFFRHCAPEEKGVTPVTSCRLFHDESWLLLRISEAAVQLVISTSIPNGKWCTG